jgi:hypothetical protein
MKKYLFGGDRPRTFSPRRPVFAGLALALFLFSTQGIGFIIHILEETDADACCRSPIACESRENSTRLLDALIVTRQAQAGHHHDPSACAVCGQFLNCVFVSLNFGPACGLPLPSAFDIVLTAISPPASTEILPYNLRAPPPRAQA